MGERIAFVGRATIDLTVRVPHRAAPGLATFGGPLVATPGGKALNQAYAAARLGGDVTLVANAGADHWGDQLTATLAEAGVDGLRLLPGVPTSAAIIEVTPDGESYVTLALSPAAELTDHQVQENPRLRTAQIVVTQLDLAPEVVRALPTPRLLIGNLIPDDPSVLRTLNLYVANVHEAAAVLNAPVPNATAAAEALRDLGIPAVVVTAGREGAAYSDSTGTTAVPAIPVAPVDTSGAGDAFLGALAAALATGSPLPDAVEAATRTATQAVQHPGALFRP
nr:PfkB family carbohydrate kinase [uncultured Actinoplanes sp.]